MIKDLFWKIRYHYIAKKGNKVKATSRAVSEETFSNIMEDIIQKMDFNQEDIVLDIGCANAELLRRIAKDIKIGIGMDSVKEMLAAAKKNTAENENIIFEEGDMRDLSIFPNEKFTKVISYSAFHYLKNKKEAFEVITQIKRICKKECSLVLIGDLPDDQKGIIDARGIVDKISYLFHIRYNREELVNFILELGGKAIALDQNHSLPHHYQMFDLVIKF